MTKKLMSRTPKIRLLRDKRRLIDDKRRIIADQIIELETRLVEMKQEANKLAIAEDVMLRFGFTDTDDKENLEEKPVTISDN
jgi:hypothetical protein